ncbi:rhodanese-like domain-containing protein [Carbonactinospora thermoautotrophica]|uniref:rhodanese-like domain-containing protein n=1 Tax=Carbonactinospora thermoautotrophica TaxID=1469144 RepID=UPI000AE9F721
MSTSTNTPARIDAAALRQLAEFGNTLRLIDVRAPGEFDSAHIPGSYHVPLDLLREHCAELRSHLDEQVVLVSGQRAGQAQRPWPPPACPTCGCSTEGSAPGRPPAPRFGAAAPAGPWNARSGWWPARPCWPRSWPAWCSRRRSGSPGSSAPG